MAITIQRVPPETIASARVQKTQLPSFASIHEVSSNLGIHLTEKDIPLLVRKKLEKKVSLEIVFFKDQMPWSMRRAVNVLEKNGYIPPSVWGIALIGLLNISLPKNSWILGAGSEFCEIDQQKTDPLKIAAIYQTEKVILPSPPVKKMSDNEEDEDSDDEYAEELAQKSIVTQYDAYELATENETDWDDNFIFFGIKFL